MTKRMGPRAAPLPLDSVIRAHGFSKTRLAMHLGIRDATLHQYLSGRDKWPTSHLVSICKLWDLDQAEVFRMAAEQEGRYARENGKVR